MAIRVPKPLVFTLLTTILATFAAFEAEAAIIPGTAVSVTVSGTVWCSTDGAPCSSCAPLGGARVVLLDKGRQISSTVTRLDGTYTLYVNDIRGIIAGVIDVSDLNVRILLPVIGCSTLATATGALQGTPQIRGLANNGALVDLVVPIYSRVPA